MEGKTEQIVPVNMQFTISHVYENFPNIKTLNAKREPEKNPPIAHHWHAVYCEMAVARGEVIEINPDEEDNPEPCVARVQAMALCEQLPGLKYGEAEDIFELSKRLCRFRPHLQQQGFANVKPLSHIVVLNNHGRVLGFSGS